MKKLLIQLIDFMPIDMKKSISKIPGLNLLLRKIFNFFFYQKEFKHTLKNGPAEGLILNVKLPEDKNLLIGNYELEFTKSLIENFSTGDVFYDLGGFKGYFSGLIALKGAKEVHVFEPLPKNILKIKELMSLNPKLNIHLHEEAVSNSLGISKFIVVNDDSMGKLEVSSFNKALRSSEVNVNTTTLDYFVFDLKNPPPNLIKIDVEGAEINVLNGAIQTLKLFSPCILIEIHGYESGKKCKEFLEKINYSILVLETHQLPDFTLEMEVCHYICKSK